MHIISYEKKIERAERRIFESDKISEKNKQTLKRFLFTYDVGIARLSLFLVQIRPFLEQFPDITTIERDGLNIWFYDLKRKYAKATISTYVGVICRLMRWVGDGELPKAFTDFKGKSGKILRNLNPDHMTEWGEGEDLVRFTMSIQLKAQFTSQLDGGYRPREFVSLNYQDISFVNGFYVFAVTEGKTGPRPVVMYRATEYIKNWLKNHPSKKPTDPLWINERHYQQTGEVKRASYAAIAKQCKKLGKLTDFKKPLDFYSLRHSSCALDKKENVPADLAAERHGHSIKYYLEVYGRLDVSDTVNRFKQHFAGHNGRSVAPQIRLPMNPPTTPEEANEHQKVIQRQIFQLQQKLSTISKNDLTYTLIEATDSGNIPSRNRSGLHISNRQEPVPPSHPTQSMYSPDPVPYPPCGTHQVTQSSKSSHL